MLHSYTLYTASAAVLVLFFGPQLKFRGTRCGRQKRRKGGKSSK